MLGRLSRWLRIIGYDVEYIRNASDEEILRRAKEEGRTVLTRDRSLYAMAKRDGVGAILLEEKDLFGQLARLVELGAIDVDPCNESRCPICGSALREIEKGEVAGRVPAKSLELYEEFWECENDRCGKVYWMGSHWRRIEERLKALEDFKSRLAGEVS
ncbi:MAG: Mut7-C RNAse domain-containing protein [Candidatus Bathyarchaeia archaeon]